MTKIPPLPGLPLEANAPVPSPPGLAPGLDAVLPPAPNAPAAAPPSPANDIHEQTSAPAMLRVEGLTMRFGGVTAVDNVSFDIPKGSISSVIGPNGAGKTTVFNVVTGMYDPQAGRVLFGGRELKAPLRDDAPLWWIFAGLSLGLLLALWVSNVDRLWRVAIKDRHVPGEAFSWAEASLEALHYITAPPLAVRRDPRARSATHAWEVVDFDRMTVEGGLVSEEHARAILEAWQAIAYAPPSRVEVRAVDNDPDFKSVIVLDGRREAGYADPDEAQAKLDQVRDSVAASHRARWVRALAFLLGLLVGIGGGYVMFQRSRRSPSYIASRGLARTFQNIRLFKHMTALENVMVAAQRAIPSRFDLKAIAPPGGAALLLFSTAFTRDTPWLAGIALFLALGLVAWWLQRLLSWRAFSAAEAQAETETRKHALEWLDFVGLKAHAAKLAKNLPYGDQRRLEIARALAASPQLVLLDEPAAGMNPTETQALMDLIRRIRDRGITVLLIEHDMKLVMGISDRVIVLRQGAKIADGPPEAVRCDPRVIEAYLGTEATEAATATNAQASTPTPTVTTNAAGVS